MKNWIKTIARILGRIYLVMCILIIFNLTSRALQVKDERRHLYYHDSITMLTNEIRALKKQVEELKHEKCSC